jgi:hypothetical protein
VSGAYLEQNSPNPYSNTTVIRYHVPVASGTARVVITDAKGALIKTISLSSRGNGQVSLSRGALAAGTYTYSLHVGGGKVDSKQMIITR